LACFRLDDNNYLSHNIAAVKINKREFLETLTHQVVSAGRLTTSGILVRDDRRSEEEIKCLIYSVISAEKIAEFEKTHELDFSFGVDGVGHFRTNVHIQKGSIAAAIRHIPDHVPSLSELNLPPILAELALKESGFILVTGSSTCRT